MSKNTRTRILLTAVAALLLVTMAVGGTLAWLQDTSNQVVNTFSPSNIEVGLTETKNNFQIIPSVDIEKDPKVSASSNVDYYVFVKITKDNWNEFLTYEKADGWQVLTGSEQETEMVIYQSLAANAVLTNASVLKGDVVKVNKTMTEADMPEATKLPTLTLTAYAIQQQGFDTVQDAWNEAQKLNPDSVVNVPTVNQ